MKKFIFFRADRLGDFILLTRININILKILIICFLNLFNIIIYSYYYLAPYLILGVPGTFEGTKLTLLREGSTL